VFSAGGAGGAQSKPPAITNAPVIDDPLGDKTQPVVSLPTGCAGSNPSSATIKAIAGLQVHAPGQFCGTVEASAGASLTFQPSNIVTTYFNGAVTIKDEANVKFGAGTYIFRRGLTISDEAKVEFGAGTYIVLGAMTIQGESNVKGDGVGFYFYGPDASNNGSNSGLRITGEANVNLSAPHSGTMAGMLVWYNRKSFNNNGNVWQISSTNVRKMTGAIYIPKDKISFIPFRPIADQSPWTAIVAGTITVGGSAALTLNSNYNSPGAPPPPPGIAANTYGSAGNNIAIVK